MRTWIVYSKQARSELAGKGRNGKSRRQPFILIASANRLSAKE